jgi:hypothetical protein
VQDEKKTQPLYLLTGREPELVTAPNDEAAIALFYESHYGSYTTGEFVLYAICLDGPRLAQIAYLVDGEWYCPSEPTCGHCEEAIHEIAVEVDGHAMCVTCVDEAFSAGAHPLRIGGLDLRFDDGEDNDEGAHWHAYRGANQVASFPTLDMAIGWAWDRRAVSVNTSGE